MDLIWEGIVQAIGLIASVDRAVLGVTVLSLLVSGAAMALSLILGVPLGMLLAFARFPGQRIVASVFNSGMGMPPVVVGLVVWIFLWRNGPFGFLGVLYTPAAIVVAQCVIAVPIVTALTMAAFQQLNPKLRLQIVALGASRWQMAWLLIHEARLPLLAAVIAGFGAVISEVGASMMVGGNIPGDTQVLTTAIVAETAKGNVDRAIALSVILMMLVFAVTSMLTSLQQRSRPR